MADFFIRRPIVAMVIAILTVIVGLVSLARLPISEYPPVSPTMIQATTTYRGAAAQAVMESVATPVESKVNGVDKLLYMQSFNANDGKMTLNMYFDVGTDVDIMQVNAQNRVGQAEAQLPDPKAHRHIVGVIEDILGVERRGALAEAQVHLLQRHDVGVDLFEDMYDPVRAALPVGAEALADVVGGDLDHEH